MHQQADSGCIPAGSHNSDWPGAGAHPRWRVAARDPEECRHDAPHPCRGRHPWCHCGAAVTL
ncbi:protein of unknown function [Cupriavidus taiwanensis]|nr:protein of unknown function [Cupriavidus taiwanensis]